MKSVGGIIGALDMWELAVIPALLYNSETWYGINQECIEELEKLQNLFLRVILQTPKGTPKTALKWDTGTWPMKHRIYFRKLTFANAIKLLNEESLAKQIWEEQVKNEWPGLSKESVEICRVLELPNIVKEDKKKIEWKKSVKEKCKDNIKNVLIN